MESDRKAAVFNVLTYVALGATACLLISYTLIGVGVWTPFSSGVLESTATSLPPDTPTPTGTAGIPTWTPTSTPTITPTPRPTNTRTPTLTPSITPTFPPTATPTPRVTRSPWPFTYELDRTSPQYGCGWTGVAGYVEDLDGNPLVGYPVHVWGAGIDAVVTSGSDARFNTMYGHEAAWEQFFDASPKEIEIRAQLHDPYRSDHLPISEEIIIKLPGFCSQALGFVVFTMNH